MSVRGEVWDRRLGTVSLVLALAFALQVVVAWLFAYDVGNEGPSGQSIMGFRERLFIAAGPVSHPAIALILVVGVALVFVPFALWGAPRRSASDLNRIALLSHAVLGAVLAVMAIGAIVLQRDGGGGGFSVDNRVEDSLMKAAAAIVALAATTWALMMERERGMLASPTPVPREDGPRRLSLFHAGDEPAPGVEERFADAVGTDGFVVGTSAGAGWVNIDVQINHGADASAVVQRVADGLRGFDLPPGAFLQWAGESEVVAVG